MTRSVIFVNVKGLDDMIHSMHNVGNPGFVAVHALESVLEAAFAVTQADTHILTGRLKASGRTETDFNGKKWEGAIHYGGHEYIPPGYDTPAYYAGYEKARGGEHDFFQGLELFADKIGDAMSAHFDETMKK